MKDSADDALRELKTAIRRGTKEDLYEIVERLKSALSEESVETGTRRLEQSRDYILENWGAARLRLKHKDGVMGSSTEGHVSHVLSSRMSSRPMGWSRTGAGKMAQLLKSEKSRHGLLGKYADAMTHSVSLGTKKKVYFNEHIWGL